MGMQFFTSCFLLSNFSKSSFFIPAALAALNLSVSSYSDNKMIQAFMCIKDFLSVCMQFFNLLLLTV